MADVKAAADKAFLAMMEAVRKGPAVREKMAMLSTAPLETELPEDSDLYLQTRGAGPNSAVKLANNGAGPAVEGPTAVDATIEKEGATPRLASLKRQKAEQKREAKKNDNAGKKWFGMQATEVTAEVATTLKLLKMRHVLNPKHFMKADRSKKLPKYFQIGTVVDGAQDYYSEGRAKKKTTMVDDLLADASFRQYHKKKYNTIQAGKVVKKGRQFKKGKGKKGGR